MEKSVIIRYLLGVLPEQDCRSYEESYLTDDVLFTELLAAENALILSYVFNELLPQERRQFEQYFLCSSERKRRVELAASLTNDANESRLDGKPPSAGLPRRSIWRSLLNRL